MDLIEAQMLLSYLKVNRSNLEIHVPRLQRVVDWCANRIAFAGSTLRGGDPQPSVVEEVGREARLLIDQVRDGRKVLPSVARNRLAAYPAIPNTAGRGCPHIKHCHRPFASRRPRRGVKSETLG